MPDSVLRVLTCGSVDDGKSTLIGRLLFECGTIPDDVMAALERDSKRFGTVEGATDYALLVDGLEAEREQGVTIDVAYRFFETPRRRFILADTPGHQQYTRNMATGASLADVAVLLVDARKGLLAQTRRHAAIASLRLLNVNRADSRLDCANRVVPVANHPLAAVRKDEIGVRAQKRLEFRVHRLGDQPTRPNTQDFC